MCIEKAEKFLSGLSTRDIIFLEGILSIKGLLREINHELIKMWRNTTYPECKSMYMMKSGYSISIGSIRFSSLPSHLVHELQKREDFYLYKFVNDSDKMVIPKILPVVPLYTLQEGEILVKDVMDERFLHMLQARMILES